MLRFHSEEAWKRITSMATKASRRLVAVPFLTSGAAKRLPLVRGDLLITRFDDLAIKTGQIDPREIVKYLRRRVEIHAVANLHAKVFVLGNRALVGSTNVSASSERLLIEAACETDDPAFVRACVRFIEALRGDIIGIDFARTKLHLYRPPQIVFPRGQPGRKSGPTQSKIAAVALTSIDFDDADNAQVPEGRLKAKQLLEDTGAFTLDEFRWTGRLPAWLRPGIRVLACAKTRGKIAAVAAPARVLHIRRYRSARGGKRALIFLERPKWSREKSITTLTRQLGEGRLLLNVKGSRLLSAELGRRIGALWARRSG